MFLQQILIFGLGCEKFCFILLMQLSQVLHVVINGVDKLFALHNQLILQADSLTHILNQLLILSAQPEVSRHQIDFTEQRLNVFLTQLLESGKAQIFANRLLYFLFMVEDSQVRLAAVRDHAIQG